MAGGLVLAALVAFRDTDGPPATVADAEDTETGTSSSAGSQSPGDTDAEAADQTTTIGPLGSSTTALPPTPSSTIAPPPGIQPTLGPGSVFVASPDPGSAAGADYTAQDVVVVGPDGSRQLYVDGSDLGLVETQRIDGFEISSDGTLLFSLAEATALAGTGPVDDADVVAFRPTSLGEVTSGELWLLFDGSAHGLDTPLEGVDAVGQDRYGNLLVSTKGSADAGFGRVDDEDVLLFDGNGLSLFLDGTAAGLDDLTENVTGVSVHPSGVVHLTTSGAHQVDELTGDRTNVLQCMPMTADPITTCTWARYWGGATASPIGGGFGGLATTDMVGYYIDFDGPLGFEWVRYDSVGHAGWGLRRPSAIEVRPGDEAETGGLLTITAKMGEGAEAGQLVSGGLKLNFPQTYGRYTVRVRADPDPDDVTSAAVLLWPESNLNPRDGEIDIVESWRERKNRTPVESTLHWLRRGAVPPYTLADDAKTQVIHDGVDGTVWHVYELEWRENLVSVSVDGGPARVLSTDPTQIADWNMEPTVQLDAFDAYDAPGLQPTMTGSVTMSVDYLIVRP